MLNALIQNGNQTAVLELPSDPFTLQYELAQIGVRSRLRDIPIKDDEESPIRVKLFADSDIYVSFWHSGEDYFMENETDFRQRMSDNLGFEEQRIGGM